MSSSVSMTPQTRQWNDIVEGLIDGDSDALYDPRDSSLLQTPVEKSTKKSGRGRTPSSISAFLLPGTEKKRSAMKRTPLTRLDENTCDSSDARRRASSEQSAKPFTPRQSPRPNLFVEQSAQSSLASIGSESQAQTPVQQPRWTPPSIQREALNDCSLGDGLDEMLRRVTPTGPPSLQESSNEGEQSKQANAQDRFSSTPPQESTTPSIGLSPASINLMDSSPPTPVAPTPASRDLGTPPDSLRSLFSTTKYQDPKDSFIAELEKYSVQEDGEASDTGSKTSKRATASLLRTVIRMTPPRAPTHNQTCTPRPADGWMAPPPPRSVFQSPALGTQQSEKKVRPDLSGLRAPSPTVPRVTPSISATRPEQRSYRNSPGDEVVATEGADGERSHHSTQPISAERSHHGVQERSHHSTQPQLSAERSHHSTQPISAERSHHGVQERSHHSTQPQLSAERSHHSTQPISAERSHHSVQPQLSAERSHHSTQLQLSAERSHHSTQPISAERSHHSTQLQLSAERSHHSTQLQLSAERSHHRTQLQLSAERSHRSTQPQLSAEQSHHSTQPQLSAERSHHSTQPQLSAERSHHSTQLQLSAERSHRSTQPQLSAERSHHSIQERSHHGVQERSHHSTQPQLSAERSHHSVQPQMSAERSHHSTQPQLSAERSHHGVQERSHRSTQPQLSAERSHHGVQERSHHSTQPQLSAERSHHSTQPISAERSHHGVQERSHHSTQPQLSAERSHHSIQERSHHGVQERSHRSLHASEHYDHVQQSKNPNYTRQSGAERSRHEQTSRWGTNAEPSSTVGRHSITSHGFLSTGLTDTSQVVDSELWNTSRLADDEMSPARSPLDSEKGDSVNRTAADLLADTVESLTASRRLDLSDDLSITSATAPRTGGGSSGLNRSLSQLFDSVADESVDDDVDARYARWLAERGREETLEGMILSAVSGQEGSHTLLSPIPQRSETEYSPTPVKAPLRRTSEAAGRHSADVTRRSTAAGKAPAAAGSKIEMLSYPLDEAVTTLQLANSGKQDLTLKMSISGDGASFFDASPRSLVLTPGQGKDLEVHFFGPTDQQCGRCCEACLSITRTNGEVSHILLVGRLVPMPEIEFNQSSLEWLQPSTLPVQALQARNLGDSCGLEAEIIGGGDVFSFDDGADGEQRHTLRMGVGALHEIRVRCRPSPADEEPPSAVLLVRATPNLARHAKQQEAGSTVPSLHTSTQPILPRSYTFFMKCRESIAVAKQDPSLKPGEEEPSTRFDAVGVDVMPRQLRLTGSSVTGEALLTSWLYLKQQQSRGGHPTAFTVRCPHPHVTLEPTEGTVRGGASTKIRVSIPVEHAAWLRCTAIEVEIGDARRSVPVEVQCSPAVSPPEVMRVGRVPPTPAATHSGVNAESVFFRGAIVNFGAVQVGSMLTSKVRLCNSSHEQATVQIADPGLPFLIMHHQLNIRARSYVKLPIKFLPVVRGDFETVLVVYERPSEDQTQGQLLCRVTLVGTAI